MLLPSVARSYIAKRTAERCLHATSALRSGGGDVWWGMERNAGREIVGWGSNGEPIYCERQDYWYPAIRFRKEDERFKQLREKEKGDWKHLTLEEKKELYRYNFCRTYSEFAASHAYWKPILAAFLGCCCIAMWMQLFIHEFVYPPIPPTFKNAWKELMLERMIDMRAEPITGVSSKWDYEKGRWKK